jgi:NAD(P)-dependent dehydrogenase (short-subunit alcohol dehydrogenase family)
LKGKVVLVTGATSGIGMEAAMLFARRGLKVAASGRNRKAGEKLIQNIQAEGCEALFIEADMKSAVSIQNMVQTVERHFGGLDFALNNAGIEGELGPLADMEEKAWDEVVDTNLKGKWLCMKYEIRSMLKQGKGSIVNISTNISNFAMAGTAAYAASKAGVNALTRVAAIEYGKMGVRVNAVSPGAVETPMIRRIFPSDVIKGIAEDNPVGRIASGKDIAQAALWLFSAESEHVNGVDLVIDGGHSLQV